MCHAGLCAGFVVHHSIKAQLVYNVLMVKLDAKWLGALVGFFLTGGNLFGALLGYVVVNLFVGGATRGGFHTSGWSAVQRTRSVFFRSTFEVMGHLAKADGRVSEHEIGLARQVMQQMRLSPEMKREAIAAFNQGKAPDFDLLAALQALKAACGHTALLHLFADIQWRFVNANGVLPAQRRILDRIYQSLGLGQAQAGWYQQQRAGYQNNAGSYSQPSTASQLREAYALLGLPRPSSNANVKRAYRKMMSQHHPDKLMAKGLPEEMIKLATEKTQKIQAAYELICQHHDFAT